MWLGRVLRRWRVKEELSIREAAVLVGVTPGVLQRLENGRGVTSQHLSHMLGWLLSNDEPVEPAPRCGKAIAGLFGDSTCALRPKHTGLCEPVKQRRATEG